MYLNRMILWIWLLVIGCNAVRDEVLRFLQEHGFENLGPSFVDQEVEVRQIPTMPDNLLLDLGVRTIGARLRIRSAASEWLQSEVFCMLDLLFSKFGDNFFPARWGRRSR